MSDNEESDEEEEDVKGPWPTSVSIAEGKLHFRKRNYQKALDSFNYVLAREPKNVKILNARSKCYYMLKDYDQALKDVEDALKFDPRRVENSCQKGEIEYIKGDFEFAYITFQRGYAKRPDYENFRWGFQKCKDAVLKSIGPQSGLKLNDKDVKMVEYRLKEKRKEQFSGRKEMEKAARKVKTTSRDIYASRILLRDASEDKRFFEKILSKKCLKEEIDTEDTTLEEYCLEAVQYLNDLQKFWQSIYPLYSKLPSQDRMSIHENRELESKTSKYYIDLANKLIKDQNYDEIVKVCTKALEVIPFNEFHCKANILDIMGRAYSQLNDNELATHCHLQQEEIAEKHLSQHDVYKSLNNLAEDHVKAKNYKEATLMYQKILKSFLKDVDKRHILKEIYKCQLHVNDDDETKDIGQQALHIAETTSNDDLEKEILNLLTKAESK